MDSAKRYSSSKSSMGKYKGEKIKEANKSSSSRQKLFETQLPELEHVNLPVVKQSDLATILPRYTAVLARSSEDGVGMDDLDQIQQELERLLSNSAVRQRLLRQEVESIDRVEERKDKRAKPYDKLSVKRKRIEEKPKYKDARNVARILKTKHAVPVNSFITDLPVRIELPKAVTPRPDTARERIGRRFWLSVDPYCQEVSKDNVCFLDELIQECSEDLEIKIPEIGEHYALEWADHTIHTEQSNGSMKAVKKQQNSNTFNSDSKKNGINNSIIDTFPSPLTQRLLDTLIEEKVIKQMPTVFEKLKAGDYSFKTNNGMRSGLCLDRRLRKELVEQGIIDMDDLPKSFPPEDEILLEIKKCQQELTIVNKHNITELNKLRTVVARDIKKQDVKAALDKVDKQVMNMYSKILITKQKHAADLAEAAYENLLSKPNLTDYEEEAKNIIKQQVLLHHELTELTDFSLLGNE